MVGNASRPGPVYGALNLDLGAARYIVKKTGIAENVTVVCRQVTTAATTYLGAHLGARLEMQVLDRAPYYLSAQELCDEHRRNFRCDAIESVIAVAKSVVNDLQGELDTILRAMDVCEADDIIRKFLRHQAGETFRDHVYLGYHLIFRLRSRGHSCAELLLPRSWWVAHFPPVFDGTGLAIGLVPAGSKASAFIRLVRRIVPPDSASAYVESSTSTPSGDAGGAEDDFGWLSGRREKWQGVRASGVALDGLDAGLRNNLGWAWQSSLPLDALAIFWAVKPRPATSWERGVGKMGAHIVDMLPGGNHQMDCESNLDLPDRRQRIIRLCMAFMRIVRRHPGILRMAQGRWLVSNLAILFSRTGPWLSMYSRMSVRVHVEFDYGVETYARAFAIRSLGGVVILDQRSHYYDNYDHTSDRPGDLAFLAGPCSLRYYSPRLFEVGGIVITGLGKDGEDIHCHEHLVPSGRLPTVAVLDEPGILYGPEHAIRFVSSMIEHCVLHGGYQIVLKPKRKKELIGKLPSAIVELLEGLCEEGRARVLASEMPVATVCMMSDIVVSVPSTAAYIGVGVGRPVLVYNPFHTIRTAFYEHGLEGRYIFTDLEPLLLRLAGLLECGVFDSQPLERTRKALDPWLDMKGNERKGYFISRLIHHLSSGMRKSEAIMITMTDYRERYGAEACGDWQSVWAGAGESARGLMEYPPRYDRISVVVGG